jgi:diacylglycerol kinase family enzyme
MLLRHTSCPVADVAHRRAIVILNRGSGTLDKRALVETITRSLSTERIAADVRIARSGRELVAAATEAAAGDADLVVAGGGDGTMATVATRLVDSGKPLGVLPLGTFNYFARNLGVPVDLDAALALIARGDAMPVDVGEVNGYIFLNNASIGLYPAVLAKRETIYRRFGRSQFLAYVSAALALLQPPALLNLTLTADGALMSRRTPMLFIGANAFQLESFEVGGQACVHGGRLALYVTRPLGGLGLIRLATRALLRGLHGATDFDVVCAREVLVALRRRRIGVAMDGEVKHIATPLRFSMRRAALRVISGPREPGAGS